MLGMRRSKAEQYEYERLNTSPVDKPRSYMSARSLLERFYSIMTDNGRDRPRSLRCSDRRYGHQAVHYSLHVR